MVRSSIVALLVTSLPTIASAQPADRAQAADSAQAQPAQPVDPSVAPAPTATTAMPPSGPPSTVPVAPVPPAVRASVMDRRWSVGFQLGWENLTIQHGDKPKVTFGVVELAGRFRIRPTIEVGLDLWAGGTAGDIGIGGVYAEFRYRFRAEQPWNFYALGALGVMSVAQKMASDDEKQGRGSLKLGIGGERRFAFGLAVDAELGIATIAENTKAPDPVMPSTAGELSRYGLGGGFLLIGVTYYF